MTLEEAALDELDRLGDVMSIQSMLDDDLETIRRYGDEQPATWGGLWFENEPAVVIVATFTGDLARHEAALRSQLRYPTRLAVRRSRYSMADLGRVRQEIEDSLRQRAAQTGRPILHAVGVGKGIVQVDLRADQEAVASELAGRYGNAVELRVGNFAFPGRRPRRPSPARPPGTPAPPELEEAVFAGLQVRLQVDQPVLAVGDDGHAQFVLHNRGQERIGPLTHDQPLTGSLLNTGQETAGGFHGAIIGTGRTLDLAPGQSASVGVIFGTASSRPELGYTLPPGQYWLRVRLPFRHGRLVPGGPTHKVTAPLTEITIVPRAQPGQ